MAYSATAKRATQEGIDLAIPHEMTTSEWAAEYRYVGRGARKGKWSNETVPFLVEIMDASDDPRVREITFQKPSQIGGSEFLSNIVGKRMHQAPTEIAYVGEKEDKATSWTQESFDTMVAATPALRKLVSDRPELNNQKYKWFSGGGLYIIWATSPAELSSRPFEILLFDEKAAYKPTNEGDPVALGEERQNTYDETRLTVKNSTPRRCDCTSPEETCGDISHDFEAGDQREYYVPCPHCNEFQTLKFGGKDCSYGLKWDPEAPEAPYYLCEFCGSMIEEFDKEDMLSKGRWLAAKEFIDKASFKINQLYSPFVSWATIVDKWLKACKNTKKLEVFTNTTLASPWKPVDSIEYEDLAWNLEPYPAAVPLGVLVLTAAVDVQKDRIECEIVGWGMDNECWAIAYKVFYGSPGIEVSNDDTEDEGIEPDDEGMADVWEQLTSFLTAAYIGETGQVFRVQCAAIDSGYLARIVYKFVRKHRKKRWFAVKGMSDPFKPLLSKPTLQGQNPKVQMFPIGTNAAKDEVFAALKVIDSGSGKCHFPDAQPYNEEEHMKMYASERMVTHTRGGRTYRVYEKIGASVRNEALDLRVYNVAARTILNPNYELIARRRLQHGEVADREAEPLASAGGQDGEDPKPPQPTSPAKVLPFKKGIKSFRSSRF